MVRNPKVLCQALAGCLCSAITHKIGIFHNLCSIFQHSIPTGRNLSQTKTHLPEHIISTRKWKFYFSFQMTECFFRKHRNHLPETNSWSSPLGNRTASFLWTSEEFQIARERTTNDENRSFYRSHILKPTPRALLKRKIFPLHSHLSRKACPGTSRWRRRSTSTQAQTNNWEIMPAPLLEAQSSSFYLRNGVIQHILSGPDHKPLDWDFTDIR